MSDKFWPEQARKTREEFYERNIPVRIIRYLRDQFDTLILAYSGGTDSTYLLLMMQRYDIDLDYVIYNNTGLEYQDTITYVHNIIDKLNLSEIYREIIPKISVKETLDMILEDFNKYYVSCKHDKQAYRCCYYVKKMPMIYWLKENELDLETTCVLRGQRANESSQRLMTALQLIERGKFYFFDLKHAKYAKVSDPIRFVGDNTKRIVLESFCDRFEVPLPETSGCINCPIFYKFANDEEKKTKRYQITKRFFEKRAKALITSYCV